ncbi:MAG TPA: hypothetical protein VNJ04_18665 [Gemmatimonadaceae bacterium]|nr:hypothetical protein [Gemmatimonadaceae bacterium]
MLRHLGLIAVCACIVTSVGCGGGKLTAPDPPPPPTSDPNATVTVEFGGRVVHADAGGPVGNVRVSLGTLSEGRPVPPGWVFPKDTATSGEDGTFTLTLNLPSSWRYVYLRLTAPPGYDDTQQWFGPTTAADRPASRMYPTLVIRPGESIEVPVDWDLVWCGWDMVPCRRVLVAASPGDSVELEVVSHDSSKPMALGLASPKDCCVLEPDMSVRRLMVPPGGVPYVLGAGTARLTARR